MQRATGGYACRALARPRRYPLIACRAAAVPPPNQFAKIQHVRSAEETNAIQVLAQQECLTLNTLVQGAWALLAHYSGERNRYDLGIGEVALRIFAMAQTGEQIGAYARLSVLDQIMFLITILRASHTNYDAEIIDITKKLQ